MCVLIALTDNVFPLSSKVTKTPGLRPMNKEDIAGIHSLLQANLLKFHLSPILSLQEVEHWLLPKENVIDTYVVQVGSKKSFPCQFPKNESHMMLQELRIDSPLPLTHRVMTAH